MSAFGPVLPTAVALYLASITAVGLSWLSCQVRSGSIAAVFEIHPCRSGGAPSCPSSVIVHPGLRCTPAAAFRRKTGQPRKPLQYNDFCFLQGILVPSEVSGEDVVHAPLC